MPSHLIFPDPGAVTFQSWVATGWSLTRPDPEAVDPRCLVVPHHHRCTPWLYPAAAPHMTSGPVGVDDSRPVTAAFPVSHTGPWKMGDVDGTDPRDPVRSLDASTEGSTSTSPGRLFDDAPRPASAGQHPDGSTITRAVRSRALPVAAATKPIATPMKAPCLRAAYLVGRDRRMLAHLRSAVDAMGVVVNHRHAACAAMVDYLSQARA
jgi:hypothetical protein